MAVPGYQRVADVETSVYQWSNEFTKRQKQVYPAQNIPYVKARSQVPGLSSNLTSQGLGTVDELLKAFLSIWDNDGVPHGPSDYRRLELEAFCAPGDLQVLEQGTDGRVTRALALLDDRCHDSDQTEEPTAGGQRRNNAGPLNAAQLLQELKKNVRRANISNWIIALIILVKRYYCNGQPNAARRLIYVTDPDCWVVLALASTASRHQALFLADFFYKYLGFKTSLSITLPSGGVPLFALEFHLQFYVWREGEPLIIDPRRKHNGKPLRRSRELRSLDIDEQPPVYDGLGACIYEAQVSCVVTGLDHDSWLAYMFADIYYQGDSSYESVDYYSQPSITPQPGVALQPVQPDPLMAGTADANIPTWTPREYFLRVYECRLKNMKHELHNVVSRLLSKLEPYVQDPIGLMPSADGENNLTFDRKKQVQQMVNEANRLLLQTIHSICRAVEVWDTFRNRDARYLSDILEPKASDMSSPREGKAEKIPPFRVFVMIAHHVNDMKDLQRRAEELQERCTGLDRELERQLAMEDNEITSQQKETGELVKALTAIGFLFVPLTTTAALFSMQPGIIPEKLYTGKMFFVFYISLTALIVILVVLFKIPFRSCCRRRRPGAFRARFTRWRRQSTVSGSRRSLLSDHGGLGGSSAPGAYTDDVELGSLHSSVE